MRPSAFEFLRHVDLPAFLITNPVNIRYITGAIVSTGALVATIRGWTLFVDGRYEEGAGKQVRKGIRVRGIDSLQSVLKKIAVCGCESDKVTLGQMDFWKKKYKNTKFVHKWGAVAVFRRAKDLDELRSFRSSQRITRALFTRVPSLLRPGVTERELSWSLQCIARKLGADEMSFEPIVGFGSHTAIPHHYPTARSLKRGDLVQIDIGVKVHGYCSDQSRVFFTGKRTALQERVLLAVSQAKDAATEAVKEGVTTHELDRIARRILRRHGFEQYFIHSLGHGVGLEIHEGVTLSTKRPVEALKRHEIITIEPGVYLPGKFGMRLEDEVIVGRRE